MIAAGDSIAMDRGARMDAPTGGRPVWEDGRYVEGREATSRSVAVSAIMSRPLITIAFQADLATARRTMRAYGIHHLLIEDRGRVVAIVSDRDVNRGLSPLVDTPVETRQDAETLRKRVFQVATFHPVVIAETASIEEATALILEEGISALPVVDGRGQVAGIITTRDLLRGLLSCVLPRAA